MPLAQADRADADEARLFGDGLAWLTRVLEGTHAQDIESLSDSLLAQAGARQDDVALLVLRA